MAQVSLYLNDATMERLRACAEGAGESLSRYVAQLIAADAARDAWPEGYWEGAYGCLADESFQVPQQLDGAMDGSLATSS